MAEIHIIGQVEGASEFASKQLFCKFGIYSGNLWKLIQGKTNGQTQIDVPVTNNKSVWSHPIDVHYATTGMNGWPRIWFEVYSLDKFERIILQGYGCCFVPTSPGLHNISCRTWRPAGSLSTETRRFFLNEGIHVVHNETIFLGGNRHKLQTEGSGIVHCELGVILRNFHKFGIEV